MLRRWLQEKTWDKARREVKRQDEKKDKKIRDLRKDKTQGEMIKIKWEEMRNVKARWNEMFKRLAEKRQDE